MQPLTAAKGDLPDALAAPHAALGLNVGQHVPMWRGARRHRVCGRGPGNAIRWQQVGRAMDIARAPAQAPAVHPGPPTGTSASTNTLAASYTHTHTHTHQMEAEETLP